MKFKLKGRSLVQGDILSPEIVCAEFTEALNYRDICSMVNILEHGHAMLNIFNDYGRENTLEGCLKMINEMKNVSRAYRAAEYRA